MIGRGFFVAGRIDADMIGIQISSHLKLFMKILLYIVIALSILIGIGSAAAGIYVSASASPGWDSGEFMMGVIFPIGMLLFFVIVFGLAFRPLITSKIAASKMRKQLRMTGVKGTARILSVQDTGITINNSPFAKVTIEVKPGITAEFSTTVGRLNIPREGDMIEVVYDPSNPSIVLPASML